MTLNSARPDSPRGDIPSLPPPTVRLARRGRHIHRVGRPLCLALVALLATSVDLAPAGAANPPSPSPWKPMAFRQVLPVLNPGPNDLVPTPSGTSGVTISTHRYGTHANHYLKVYKPTRVRVNGGVIVWLHGGSWLYGDPAAIERTDALNEMPALMDLVRRGWTVVGVQYRFTSTSVHVEDINADVDTALAWTRRNLAATSARTVVIGQSSGAYLAIAAGNKPTGKAQIAGWVAIEAPTDFRAINVQSFRYGASVVYLGPIVSTMLDCPLVGTRAQCAASRYDAVDGPDLVASAADPAAGYLVVSSSDELLPPLQHASPMIGALTARRESITFDPIEGARHNQAASKLNYTALRSWLHRVTGVA